MEISVEQLLNELEKPENASQIKYLANLKNLEYVENVKNIGGLAGFITKFAMRFTQKHINAFMVLAECESADDIADFKKTVHYEKIKNSSIGTVHLGQLEELSKLKSLEKFK